MNTSVITWLNDPLNWQNQPSDSFVGIPSQTLRHLEYSGIALGIALVIALPAGLAIGHTRRATWIVSLSNAVRAVPTVGVIVLLAVVISPHFRGRTDIGFLIPTEIVLVLIAIPSILSNTYAGVDNVPPLVREAATGVGMTGWKVLWQVELPNSLPLIFSGFRSATLQVIATATIAAYFPLGGLGRFIYDGYAVQDYPQMVGGGIVVAVLAVVVDLVLAGVQRLVVSRGVSGRFSTRGTQGGGALATVTGTPEQVRAHDVEGDPEGTTRTVHVR